MTPAEVPSAIDNTSLYSDTRVYTFSLLGVIGQDPGTIESSTLHFDRCRRQYSSANLRKGL